MHQRKHLLILLALSRTVQLARSNFPPQTPWFCKADEKEHSHGYSQ